MKDFDHRYTNDTILMLKAAALFAPQKEQNYLALFIKFMELNFILGICKNPPVASSYEKPNLEEVACDLKQKLHKENAQKIETLLQFYKAYEMYRQVKDLMDVLGPDALSSFMGNGGEKNDSGDEKTQDLSFLSSFMSGDNTELLNLLQMMQSL